MQPPTPINTTTTTTTMVNTSFFAALAILSVPTCSALFIHTFQQSRAIQQTSSLQNDYLEQLDTPSFTSSTSNDYTNSEKFHRSLLEAKLAYDAIDAALSTTPSSYAALLTSSTTLDDAPTLNNPAFASGPLDHEIIVDDECYMGKDGQLDECADFGKRMDTYAEDISVLIII